MSVPRPPRWALVILAALLPPRYRDNQLGDLEEEYAERTHRDGSASARRWLRRQVLTSVTAAVRLRLREARNHNPRRGTGMEKWRQDTKYALRALVANPLYATIAAVTLALGIGVNTAIFSLVSQVVFLELPMEDPDELVWVWTLNQETRGDITTLSLPDFEDIRDRSRSFTSISALVSRSAILSGVERPERIQIGEVTSNLIDVWGSRPTIGRGFLAGEDAEGALPVAVLSHSLWQERFGADPGVLGTTIRLNGTEHTIVGVNDPRMEIGNLGRYRILVPVRLTGSGEGRELREALVTGRLRPGVTFDEAATEVAAIGRALEDEYPATNRSWTMQLRTTDDSLLGDAVEAILLLLVLTVGLVLLIACANVANLVLVRASSRARELAMRAALGAGRGRVIRQLLTENAIIALVAGAFGLGLAQGLLILLVRVSRGREVLFTMSEIDGRVLLFTLGVSMMAPLLFGLAPALAVTRVDLSTTLREGGSRAGGGRAMNRVRSILVTAQIAVALALMITSGLAVRSVVALQRLDPGFDAAGILTMIVELPEAKYAPSEALPFFEQLEDRILALGAVEGVAYASRRPGFRAAAATPFTIDGRGTSEVLDLPTAYPTTVTPSYFQVLDVPMVRGRGFESSDGEGSVAVAIVNEAAVARFWPDDDPIGQRIQLGATEPEAWRTIVGVTRGTLEGNDLENPSAPQIFLPMAQNPVRTVTVFAATRGEPEAVVAPIRREVWTLDPEQPIDDARSLQQFLRDENSVEYAIISWFVIFAAFALVMASMGIYGVMSYMVSRRTAEISLRMALGAERNHVLRMILGQGTRLVLFGAALGMALAYALSRLITGLVYGISSTDPATFLGLPVFLALVALLANYVPAFRATRIDPMAAMRAE